jgi:hypothetical protein
MTERELMIKGLAKVIGMTEAQIEKTHGTTAALSRPALLREARPEDIAAYESMDVAALRKQLAMRGVVVPVNQTTFAAKK